MKILVTGGAGFIGGNFVLKQVLQEGNNILNFDKLTYAGNLDTLKDVENHPKYQFIQGDICKRSDVKKALSGKRNLREADLRGANLEGANFDSAFVKGMKLEGAQTMWIKNWGTVHDKDKVDYGGTQIFW